LVVSAEHTRFHHAGPQLTASIYEKFWIPRIRNFQGASNQLREVYNMLQTSSQMARVQDYLATEECGDSSHHMDLTSEDWETAVTSMKYHLKKHWVFTLPPTRNFSHYLLRYRPVYITDPCVLYPVILST